MGVHGLWELLLPVGRRVDSGHVSTKKVAVDISIWLTQFLKAMRDTDGAMVRNAHLLGVFRRCCKLLFLGVRPVFVFDGSTPALKRRTLMMRAAARDTQVAKLRKLAEKLVMNQLKLDIIDKSTRGKKKKRGGGASLSEPVSARKPPLPEIGSAEPPTVVDDGVSAMDRFIDGAIETADAQSVMPAPRAEEESHGREGGVANIPSDGTKDALSVFDDDGDVFIVGERDGNDDEEPENDFGAVALPDDIRELDDDALLNLPPALQTAVFRQIKVQQRARHREEVLEMQADPAAFSRAQMKGFMVNTALNRRIRAVHSAINDRSGASRRIVSDSAREYVLEEGPQVDNAGFSREGKDANVDGGFTRRKLNASLDGGSGGGDSDDDDDDDESWEDGDSRPGQEADGGERAEGGPEEEGDGSSEEDDILRRVRKDKENSGMARFGVKPTSATPGLVPSRLGVATAEHAGTGWATRALATGGAHVLGAKAPAAVGHHVLGGPASNGGDGPPISAAARLRRLQSGYNEEDEEYIEREESRKDPPEELRLRGASQEHVREVMGGGAKNGSGRTAAVDVISSGGEGEEDDDMEWEDGPVTEHAVVTTDGNTGDAATHRSTPLPPEAVAGLRSKLPRERPTTCFTRNDGQQSLAELQRAGVEAFAEVFGVPLAGPKSSELQPVDEKSLYLGGAQTDEGQLRCPKSSARQPGNEVSVGLGDFQIDGHKHEDDKKGSINGVEQLPVPDTLAERSPTKPVVCPSPVRSTCLKESAPTRIAGGMKRVQFAEDSSPLRKPRAQNYASSQLPGVDIEKGYGRTAAQPTLAAVMDRDCQETGLAEQASSFDEIRPRVGTTTPRKVALDEDREFQEQPVEVTLEEDRYLLERNAESARTVIPVSDNEAQFSKNHSKRKRSGDTIEDAELAAAIEASLADAVAEPEPASVASGGDKTDDTELEAAIRASLADAVAEPEPGSISALDEALDETQDIDDDDDDEDVNIAGGEGKDGRKYGVSTRQNSIASDEGVPKSLESVDQPRPPPDVADLERFEPGDSRTPEGRAGDLVAEATALENSEAGVPEVNRLTETDVSRLQAELGAESASLRKQSRKLQSAGESLSDEMYGETRDMLRLLGLPYVEAPTEAEAQCAYLNAKGIVDAVLTEDSDAFLFGAKIVYRHLFADGKFAESYEAQSIQSELGIDRASFIKLALLLGSDYTPGVRGVGIVNSMEVLEAFPGENGLSEFKEWAMSVSLADKEPSEEEARDESAAARRRRFCWKHRNMKRNWEIHGSFPSQLVVDAYMKPDVETSEVPFEWKSIDVPGLAKFCWDKFAWNREKFEEAVNPVLKQIEERRSNGPHQTVIQDYFAPHRFAKIRSTRLQSAVKGIAGADKAAPLMGNPKEAGPKNKRKGPPAGRGAGGNWRKRRGHVLGNADDEDSTYMAGAVEEIEQSKEE